MKGTAAIYLALLVVLQPVLPFIEYAVFKEYIAENLCVEKEVVGSCCKGKCFLEEKVKEVNDQSAESENKPAQIKTDPSVFLLFQNLNQFSISSLDLNRIPFYTFGAYITYGKSVFHPPKNS